MLIEVNVLPSPLTEEVTIKVLALVSGGLFLKINCRLDLIARKDSATADFGFS